MLLKIDPLDRFYGHSNAGDLGAEIHAAAQNIHCSRSQIAPETILRRCLLGITVRGAPGREMTRRGASSDGNRRADKLWKVVGEGLRSTCLETDQGLRALAPAGKAGHAKL
jgi:hypothetical protein